MPLVSMRQLLDEAAKGGYGVGAFNVNNMEQIQAIMEAARDTKSPVIIQADGGTRTASITGALVALGLALEKLVEAGTLTSVPLRDFVAAVSVGIVDGDVLLDLNYEEDSRADVDMNLVMTAGYKLVEVQASAERQVFDEQQLSKMIGLARQGVQSLIAKQQAILSMLTLRQ